MYSGIVDYLSIIETYSSNTKEIVFDTDQTYTITEPIDYLTVSKIWDEIHSGKYVINSYTKKRNPSHDPETRDSILH